MADALYILTLRTTQNIANLLNEEKKKWVETAAFLYQFAMLRGFSNPILLSMLFIMI